MLDHPQQSQKNRRVTIRMSANINVTKGTKTSVCQADFLGNSYNKQGLIKIIIEHMQAVSNNVKQAIGDADTMIVGTEVQPVFRKLWS